MHACNAANASAAVPSRRRRPASQTSTPTGRPARRRRQQPVTRRRRTSTARPHSTPARRPRPCLPEHRRFLRPALLAARAHVLPPRARVVRPPLPAHAAYRTHSERRSWHRIRLHRAPVRLHRCGHLVVHRARRGHHAARDAGGCLRHCPLRIGCLHPRRPVFISGGGRATSHSVSTQVIAETTSTPVLSLR